MLARHGYTDEVPLPDISTKAKAQAYIGLNMAELERKNQQFLDQVVPKWIDEAKKNGKLIEI